MGNTLSRQAVRSPALASVPAIDSNSMRLTSGGAVVGISNLPVELSVKIFRDTIIFDPSSGQVVPCARQSPLVLTEVCHEWRNFVRSIPSLWSSMHFRLPSNDVDAEKLKAGLEVWLSRSSPGPLYLYLQFSLSSQYRNSHHSGLIAKMFLAVFYQHSARWASVNLLPHHKPKGLKPLPKTPYPMLQSLELSGFDTERQTAWIKRIFRSTTPTLRELRWNYTRDMNAPALDHWQFIPWSQLTVLHMTSDVFAGHCIDSLSHCVNLQTCRIVLLPCVEVYVQGQRATLPNLCRLYIVRTFAGSLDLLDHCTAPCLVDLQLHGHMPPISTVAAFLERSRCSLQSLALTNTNVSEHALITCLSLVSGSLTRLDLGPPMFPEGAQAQITDYFLEKLDVVSSGRDVLAPRLIALYLRVGHSWRWTDGRLAQMVQSRFDSGTPSTCAGHVARLQSVFFDCCCYLWGSRHAKDRANLFPLVIGGLELRTHGYGPGHAGDRFFY